MLIGPLTSAGELEVLDSHSAPEAGWLQTENAEGFVSNFPSLSRSELIRQLRELRTGLQSRKANLSAAEEEGRFDAKDAVITLVLPGGLLYAAYRQQRHHRIAAQEQEVSRQLEELKADLVAFRDISTDIVLASAD